MDPFVTPALMSFFIIMRTINTIAFGYGRLIKSVFSFIMYSNFMKYFFNDRE